MAYREPAVGHGDDALFVKDGIPVRFCFHRSVTQGRSQITRDVERHGGQIIAEERLADVLLIDEQEDIAFFRRRYYSSTERYRLSLYIEPRGFVQNCILLGEYRHIAPTKRGMPGRGGGRGRVAFTEEDRDHLAYYIATQFPTRDGRMGMKAYKDLERLGQTDDPNWMWARRHTPYSWREHYKIYPGIMNARIDVYLQRLKNIGHHYGQDPRRHSYRNLRRELQEEEEEEGSSEAEVEEQGGGPERQDNGGRGQARAAVAAERRPLQVARDYLARHEQDLLAFDEQERDDIQEKETWDSQCVKRRRVHPDAQRQRNLRETQAKRTRMLEGSTNKRQTTEFEINRAETSPGREEGSDNEESIEGSDLFGDHTYQDGSHSDFDNAKDIDDPASFLPAADPVVEQDGPPPSTQATLIASPRPTQKKHTPASDPTSTEVIKETVKPTIPPSSQQTRTQERQTVPRARVRGVSAQPGPSMSREARTAGEPHRDARARSRSAEVQPQPQRKSQLPRQQEGQKGGGRGKAKEVLDLLEEDVRVEGTKMDEYTEEDFDPALVTVREMVEDEMAVEDILEASVTEEKVSGESGDEDDGGEDEDEEVEIVAEDGDEDEDEDGDVTQGIPPTQVIEIEDDPSDSDDAETHASLVRGAVQSEVGAPGSDQDQGQDEDDEDSDDDSDSDRVNQMANKSLYATHTSPPLPSRVTRSMTATQAQTQQVSPRRTRNQARAAVLPTTFPSPGTKARAVIDRFREEERKVPYAPPSGTRAAKVVKRRERR